MTVITHSMFDNDTPPLEDKGYEQLPLGQHVFRITGAEYKTSEGAENPPKARIQLDVEIIESGNPMAVGKTGRDAWWLPHPSDTKPISKQFWKSVAQVAPAAVTARGVDADKLIGLVYKAEVLASTGKDGRTFHNPKYAYPLRYEAPKMPEAGGDADAGPVDAPF